MTWLKTRIAKQSGAATIETMFTMVMLLMCLLMIVFVGTVYYNINLMDTATQNMSLSSATQLDHYCRDQNSPYCGKAEGKMKEINGYIKD